MDKLVRPNILTLKGYSSARDEFDGAASVMLDANESPFGTGVNRYPDPYQRAIKQQLAKIKEVNSSQIFLGNGSDEAIDVLFRIFCEPGVDNIAMTNPTYGMYEVSAGINDVAVKKVPLSNAFELVADNVLQAVDEHTKMIFLCSPNNPSGNLLNQAEVLKIADTFKGILIVDEAYIDFSTSKSLIDFLSQYKRLVILQTFSKAWGLAGIRLGMAFADPAIIKLMNKVKPPYNINGLTQQYALEALKKSVEVDQQVKEILDQRESLEESLQGLAIVKHIYPSDSNFLLVKFESAQTVFEILRQKGIIVRDRSNVLFGENCLRITVGTSEENQALINVLKSI